MFFTRFAAGNVVQGYGFKPSSLGLPGVLDTWTPQFPQISFGNTFSGQGSYAPLGATQNSGEATFPENNGSLNADLNKSFKAHSVSIGYLGIWQTTDGGRLTPTVMNFSVAMTAGPDPSNPATSTNGDGLASFLAGAGNSGVGSAGTTGYTAFAATTNYLHGMYVQDDWKANRKLTLNLGVRYEIQMPATARHNQQAYFDFHALNPISAATGIPVTGEIVYNTPGNRGLYQQNLHDLAPRVGFTYAILPKLVMRGGYGWYYARNWYGGSGPDPGYSTSTAWTSSPDGITVTTPLAQAFQTGLVPVTGNALGSLTGVGQGGGGVNPFRPDPLTKEFAYGFQYAFTTNDVLDVAYVGGRGSRITIGGMNYGQLNPSYLSQGSALVASAGTNPYAHALSSLGLTAMACPWTVAQSLMPYPEFCGGASATDEPVGINNYNALQANFKHRFGAGLILTASYTFSKFLSDVAGPEEWGSVNGDTGGSGIRNYYDLKADWTVDGEDIPESLVLNYVYELPVGRGKTFGSGMNRAAGCSRGRLAGLGDYHRAERFPDVDRPQREQLNRLWRRPTCKPDRSAIQDRQLRQRQRPVTRSLLWERSIASSTRRPLHRRHAYTFGTGPRYYSNLRAPRYVDEDLTLGKWFNLVEGFKLQFAVQMFNAFNHPNFGIPDSGVGDGTMGESSSTQGAREMQGVLKVTF